MSTPNRPSEHGDLTAQAHTAVRLRLPDYAAAAVCGRNPERLYPAVAAHLERCTACRDALHELLELAAAAYTGEVDPAPSYPPVDLSFLGRDSSSAIDGD
jgi:hypothetical protein